MIVIVAWYVGGSKNIEENLIIGGATMEIDKWVNSCKIRAFPWIDGKQIYFNVQYFAPGQSISKPPVWDKTVYIKDNEAGRRFVYQFTHSLVEYVIGLAIPHGGNAVIQVAS